ncbi:MAG: hypothetical protein EOM68_05975 [Spirochaetia bacterium]|nr:hypothetical protein [Spirochaetia bacterium]
MPTTEERECFRTWRSTSTTGQCGRSTWDGCVVSRTTTLEAALAMLEDYRSTREGNEEFLSLCREVAEVRFAEVEGEG